MCLLQKNFFNFFNFDNIDLLSIGSGNGLFESFCQTIFGIPIICVDPFPPKLQMVDGEIPFIKPMFNYTVDYLDYDKKKDETVLFLIWPEPTEEVEDENPYDLDAIILLQPLAFFIIYSDVGFLAGSKQFRELIKNNNFKVGFQTYKKKLQRNGNVNITGFYSLSSPNAVMKIALFVNDSKYQLFEENRLKFYKTPFIKNYTTVDEETIELGKFDPFRDN